MLMNTRDGYGLIARSLHWIIAILVIGMLLGGALIFSLPQSGFRSVLITVHKSTGVIILLLMVVRLIWRIYNPQPRDLEDNPVLNALARVLHIWLYVLLFIQPLSGILMSQAHGYPVVFFGWFRLPPLIWNSPLLGGFFLEVHRVSAVILIVVIVLHAAAGAKHHFIDRDRTLLRMLKGR